MDKPQKPLLTGRPSVARRPLSASEPLTALVQWPGAFCTYPASSSLFSGGLGEYCRHLRLYLR